MKPSGTHSLNNKKKGTEIITKTPLNIAIKFYVFVSNSNWLQVHERGEIVQLPFTQSGTFMSEILTAKTKTIAKSNYKTDTNIEHQ